MKAPANITRAIKRMIEAAEASGASGAHLNDLRELERLAGSPAGRAGHREQLENPVAAEPVPAEV